MPNFKKLPPALKHAGYSSLALLPGESPDEFEALRTNLIIEFAPAGVVEEDIVATLARYIWRKQNLASFQIAKEANDRFHEIRREKGADQEFVLLPDGFRSALEIGVKARDPEEVKAAEQAAVEQTRKDLGWRIEFFEIGDTPTIYRLMKELDVEERLDAMIDRQLKPLLHVRGLKSISRGSHAA
jgi:hypothetical protein